MEMLPGIAAMIFVFESKACFVEPHILSYFDRLWYQQSSLAGLEFDSSLYHEGVQMLRTQ